MTTIGERIFSAREAKGLTQQQLAAKIGCSRPLVSMWERDKVETLSGKFLTSLAAAVEKSADWILFGAEPRIKPDPKKSQPARLDIQILARSIELVETQSRAARKQLRPAAKARLSASIYAALSANEPGAERAVKQLLASILASEEAA